MRLILWDVDGTLVDSQADIIGAMNEAFARCGLPPPSREQTLSIVGLSLPVAMAHLAPDQDADALAEAYKDSYAASRLGGQQQAVLYPGISEILQDLHQEPDTLMGVATGKSKRGLDGLIQAHDLGQFFVTLQCADFHPSKPDPSMVLTAMDEAGVTPEQTIMVGDTTYDMDMAQSANVRRIGVTWGYHDAEMLAGADRVVHNVAALRAALGEM